MRKRKRVVRIGGVTIGGNSPIAVQSMTKTKTKDITKTVNQIKRLERVGCEMVRVAVVDKEDAAALSQIREAIVIPLIADIHFDYRLALKALDAQVDKIRINPGTIGEVWKVREVIKKAQGCEIPVRIGVNSGSLPPQILKRHKHPTPTAIVETVNDALAVFHKNAFDNIVVSAKGADVMDTVSVYRILSKEFDYPLHIGITEAGLPFRGGIKSAVGLAILLHEGIGDTVRVSLTSDPVMEVVAAYEILNSLGLRKQNPILISCPTCGRCEVNLEKIVRAVDKRLAKYKHYMKIAVMGCVVNGPGEAREADFGIACGKSRGMIFAKGKEIKRVREARIVDELFEVIDENLDN